MPEGNCQGTTIADGLLVSIIGLGTMQHNLMFLLQVGLMTCLVRKIKKEIQCSLPSNCLAGKSLLEVADRADMFIRCIAGIPGRLVVDPSCPRGGRKR